MSDQNDIEDYTLWTHAEALLTAAWSVLTVKPARKFWRGITKLLREAEDTLRVALAELAATLEVSAPPARKVAKAPPPKPSDVETKSRDQKPRSRSFSVLPPSLKPLDLYKAYQRPLPADTLAPRPASKDRLATFRARIASMDNVLDNPERYARRLAILLARRDPVKTTARYEAAELDMLPDTLPALMRTDPPPAIDSS